VRAVDADAQAREVRAEALEHVLEIAVGRDADLVDVAAVRPAQVEQRLDLLLLPVCELLAAAVEELDAVVLGWIVRRGDHAAEVERQQRDRGCGQNTRDDGIAAGGRDPAGERGFKLDTGRPRVAADEDAPAAAPERRGAAEPLHELSRQVLADNATDTVRAEVLSRQVTSC